MNKNSFGYMTQRESQTEISLLREALVAEIESYKLALLQNAGFFVRKRISNKMRQLEEKIKLLETSQPQS